MINLFNLYFNSEGYSYAEVVVRRCFIKNMSLEILQNSQANTFTRVSFSIKLQALGISKNTSGGGCFWL